MFSANSENSRPLLRRGKKSEIFYNKKLRFKMRGSWLIFVQWKNPHASGKSHKSSKSQEAPLVFFCQSSGIFISAGRTKSPESARNFRNPRATSKAMGLHHLFRTMLKIVAVFCAALIKKVAYLQNARGTIAKCKKRSLGFCLFIALFF